MNLFVVELVEEIEGVEQSCRLAVCDSEAAVLAVVKQYGERAGIDFGSLDQDYGEIRVPNVQYPWISIDPVIVNEVLL